MEWGKYFWDCLHLAALGYPENPSSQERIDYIEFVKYFGKVLPCSKCRNNFLRHMDELPIELYMFGRVQFFDWTVRLHNIVNRENGKKEWTYDEAWKWYTKGLYESKEKVEASKCKYGKYGKCDYNTPLLMLNIFLLVILMVALYLLFR